MKSMKLMKMSNRNLRRKPLMKVFMGMSCVLAEAQKTRRKACYEIAVQFHNCGHPFGNNFSFIITGLKRDLKITICSDHDGMNDPEGGSTVTFKDSPFMFFMPSMVSQKTSGKK
jgi:hypothetical protein